MRNCEKPKLRNGEKMKWRNGGWRRLVTLSVLLFHFLILSFSQSPQSWRDSLNTLNRQIASSPWSTDLHLRKAAVNLELQQWEYAIDEYWQVLQHDAQNPAALFYRAYANSHLRRYDLARNDYEELLRLSPKHLEARLGLAFVQQQAGRVREALEQYNLAVEQHPESAVAYAGRAAMERDMKQYEVSLYDWKEALRLQPDNRDYLVSCVDVLIAMNRQDEARRMLDEAVRKGMPRGLLREWYVKCR